MSLSINTHTYVGDAAAIALALSVRVHRSERGEVSIWIGGGGESLHMGLSLEEAHVLADSIIGAIRDHEDQAETIDRIGYSGTGAV